MVMRKLIEFSSFKYALSGITRAFKSERNFRLIILCAFLVTVFGFCFDISKSEWLILLLCCSGVIVSEMINTAIETIVDIVSPEYHESAKKIKDISAGAVLLASFFSVIIGTIIFLPYLIKFGEKL